MKFTRCAVLGLSLLGFLSGCSETETTLSVNVRYWTDYLDPESFTVKIEQDGQTAIDEPIVPRKLDDGTFDVVCDHDWELPYCRFYKRFDLAGWSNSEVTVTLSGTTLDGQNIADDITGRMLGDMLSNTFELETNEVNVVYIQLANVKTPAPTVSPDTTSDTSGSSESGGGTSDAGGDGGSTTVSDAGAADGSVPDASPVDAGDAAVADASTPDGGSTSNGATDGGATDASVADAAPDAASTDAGDAN